MATTKKMAKSSKTVKKRSTRKKRLHLSLPFHPLFIHLFVIVLTLLILSRSFITHSFTHFETEKSFAEELSSSHSGTIASLPKPTPTSTPTPTVTPQPSYQQVNTGYCLTVPIILYHHIEPLADATKEGHAQLTVDSSIFDQQMAYLVANGYNSLSLDELVDALLHHKSLPPKSIAITMDDGYIDDYQYGFKILQKYHLKGNFMIPSGLIMNPDYMTWDNIREIRSSGIGFIYNHTWSHAALGNISRSQIESELNMSQTQFQEQLGYQPNIFTYPYGSFSQTAIEVLKEHGFIAGFTTIAGRLQCESNIMTLYREHIGNAPMSAYGL